MPPKRGASGNNKRQKEDNGVIMGHKLYALKQEYPGAAQYAAGDADADITMGVYSIKWPLPSMRYMMENWPDSYDNGLLQYEAHQQANPELLPVLAPGVPPGHKFRGILKVAYCKNESDRPHFNRINEEWFGGVGRVEKCNGDGIKISFDGAAAMEVLRFIEPDMVYRQPQARAILDRFPAWVNHADFFNAPKPLEASYRLPDNSMARTLFSSQHTAANMLGCRQPLISIRLSNGGKEGEHRITLKAVAGKVSLPGREQPWETDVYFKEMLFTPASEKEIFHQTGTLMIELQDLKQMEEPPLPANWQVRSGRTQYIWGFLCGDGYVGVEIEYNDDGTLSRIRPIIRLKQHLRQPLACIATTVQPPVPAAGGSNGAGVSLLGPYTQTNYHPLTGEATQTTSYHLRFENQAAYALAERVQAACEDPATRMEYEDSEKWQQLDLLLELREAMQLPTRAEREAEAERIRDALAELHA